MRDYGEILILEEEYKAREDIKNINILIGFVKGRGVGPKHRFRPAHLASKHLRGEENQ